MAYLALYRKYRPVRFDQVVGQQAVTTTLKNAVAAGRVAHAYLFCGPRGTGKTSTAQILSRAVNCLDNRGGEACGVCGACQALSAPDNMDIIEIDAASNNSVDEVRDLREKIKYPPVSVRYKVYIVDEVHMLSAGAFNALLKTLEEPPEHALFILATTEAHRLPATIVSRCQRFDFKRIDTAVIAGALQGILKDSGADFCDEAVERIAVLAEGGMRDALSIADQVAAYASGAVSRADVDQVAGAASAEQVFAISDAVLDADLKGVLQRVDQVMRAGADAGAFVRDLAYHLRNVLVVKKLDDPSGLVAAGDIERYGAQAQKATESQLIWALEALMRLDSDLKYAAAPRVALETALFGVCFGANEDLTGLSAKLDALQRQVERLEKDGVRAPAPPPAQAPEEAVKPKREKKPRPAVAEPAGAILQEKPKPVPQEGGGKAVSELWPQMLETVKRQRISLYGTLQMASPKREGNLLTLVFDPKDELFSTMVLRDNHRGFLEEVASGIAGEKIRIDSVTGERPPIPVPETMPQPKSGPEMMPEEPPAPAEAPPELAPEELAIELFGEDKVTIVP
ncbi:MAG: DNA polymerase III subunit gamma/tau [Christensenellales bacterium]